MLSRQQKRIRKHVERAWRELDLLFLPIRRDERMKLRPIHKCEETGCGRLTARDRCELHRRPDPAISTAEAVRRRREDMQSRDELMDRPDPVLNHRRVVGTPSE